MKNDISERERRRLKVSQVQSQLANRDSETNTIYQRIAQEIRETKRRISGGLQDEKELDKQIDDLQEPDKELSFDDKPKMITDDEKPKKMEDVEVLVEESEDETATYAEDYEPISSWPCCKPYLIQENGTFRKYWEIAVIFLALYNAFIIPLQLFFDPNPNFIDNDIIRCSDAVVDLLFLIDIIFQFRTTALDHASGTEIRDPWIIAKAYLKGRFFLDFISSVPFNALFDSNNLLLDLLGLIKLTRILRIAPVIRKSNAPQHIKVYLQMTKMFFYILIALHLLCCIWHWVIVINEGWVQNMDFMYVNQDRAYQNYWEDQPGEDTNFFRAYFVGLYTGFYLFGVGEVVPRTSSTEFIVAFCLLAVCTIVNAVLIGYMASYAEELSKDSREFQNKLNLANTAMINLDLQRDLRTKIHEYINNTYTTQKR